MNLKEIRQVMADKHVGIIPDGNRRWADAHGVDYYNSHLKGAEVIYPLVFKAFLEYNVQEISVYALSHENLNMRGDHEVEELNKIFKEYYSRILNDPQAIENKIQVNVFGNINELPKNFQDMVWEATKNQVPNPRYFLNVMMPHGGRQDILLQVKKLMENSSLGLVSPNQVTEQYFSSLLQPRDLDLVIRTAEHRISNFLTWQSVYAEFMFVDKLWCDFTEEDLRACLERFCATERTMGGDRSRRRDE